MVANTTCAGLGFTLLGQGIAFPGEFMYWKGSHAEYAASARRERCTAPQYGQRFCLLVGLSRVLFTLCIGLLRVCFGIV